MPQPIVDLLPILDLTDLGQDRFEGHSPPVAWQRVFGGLVIAQALVASTRTVEDERDVHSLHAYFLLAGDPTVPLRYDVERIRDGRSFATRRVVARQNDHAIFSLSASYQRPENGLAFHPAMPDVPPADALSVDTTVPTSTLARLPDAVRNYVLKERAIELRVVDAENYLKREPQDPHHYIWIRALSPLPDDPHIHQAVLAYASDMTLLDTVLLPHGRSVFDADIMPASLDHALWFHAPFRMDEWMLYEQDSAFTGGSRGLARGQFWQNGVLVASVMQEGLVRQRRPKG